MDTSFFLRAVIVHFQVSESHLSDRKILILGVKRTVKRILTLTHASLCRIYFPSLQVFASARISNLQKLLAFPQPFFTTSFKNCKINPERLLKQKICEIFREMHLILTKKSQFSARCQQKPSAAGIPVQNRKYTQYKAFLRFTACFLEIVSIRSKLTLVNGGCLRRNSTFYIFRKK